MEAGFNEAIATGSDPLRDDEPKRAPWLPLSHSVSSLGNGPDRKVDGLARALVMSKHFLHARAPVELGFTGLRCPPTPEFQRNSTDKHRIHPRRQRRLSLRFLALLCQQSGLIDCA